MIKRYILAYAMLALPTGLCAQTTEYRAITNDVDVGYVTVDRDGNRVQIETDIKQNGRGPTTSEVVVFGDDGIPVSWTVQGTTTFGSPIDERYGLENGKPVWLDASGGGQADAPAFYITQSGSSTGLVEALFRDDDMQMPVLPGGTAKLTELERHTYRSADGAVDTITYALSGLSTAPSYVTLDTDGRLFATASPGFALVRKGYEDAQTRLRDRAAEFSAQRLAALQADHAQTFDGPVRISNVHVFDSIAKTRTGPVDVVMAGDRISLIESAGATPTAGETIIDGAGGTLVPGMYEMHGHFSQESGLGNLMWGITSIRDVGNRNDVLDK